MFHDKQFCADRLEGKYRKCEKTGCWLWIGAKHERGYGRLRIGKHTVSAHRVSWEVYHGRSVPPGQFICHSCDNASCINPEHLFMGTPGDNNLDTILKGRRPSTYRPRRYSQTVK